ncbi:MAG: hypothetical protein V1792_03100 [Pseudomonadota bacterium]
MYEIKETQYGLRIVTGGYLGKDELKSMSREAGEIVGRQKKGFGIIHDMRGMFTLPPEAREIMKRNMERAKDRGLGRVAHILDDAIATLQFKRLANEAGIADTTRNIDAGSVSDCERAALDWVVKGIDPDK